MLLIYYEFEDGSKVFSLEKAKNKEKELGKAYSVKYDFLTSNVDLDERTILHELLERYKD